MAVEVERIELPGITTDDFRDFDNSDHMKAFNELMDVSDALKPGQYKGAMLQFQRADGYAWYLVTNENPLTIAHIDYLDGWTIEPATIRGLSEGDVDAQLSRRRATRELFQKQPEAKQ